MDTRVFGLQLPEDMASSPLLQLITALPVEKQRRIKRFVHVEDAVRTLSADILSRLLLCDQLGIKNSELFFTSNQNGKPLLQGLDDLHFNNSHSGRWVLSAISDYPVGIDVERIRELDLDLARHCFSEKEYHDLNDLPDDQTKLDYFYDLWTLKESYIKAVGLGLSMPLSSFTIRKTKDMIQLQTSNTFNHCFFKQYTIDNNYKISLCAQREHIDENLVLISEDELHQRFVKYL
ncbi:4'-phosphopantetheinyl transferase [Fontibacillus panacisegetis]|uniref:4'-phosphopantetheinyl transferase n=1 Tax=Fontibacillus panacisegetis TaxID=670482 RepID=A0A1G7MEY4_9BACL|nr:4'-phosphopantetheinyl transferase superfamily protein [Fontibacillus panacisegetis]SDF60323.1 4'-phosphopantetheinyl transferase [Fontibacillus panacisegetis]